MENELEKKDISNSNISSSYLLFRNMKECKELLVNYDNFINKYLEIIGAGFKQLSEIKTNFLGKDKLTPSLIDTPIFQIGIVLQKIINNHIEYLQTLLTNPDIFDALKKILSNLSYILEESSMKFDKKMYSQNIAPVAKSLIESYEQIESKIVDDYISQKYKKHLKEVNNKESLENLEAQINYLEKTFLDFEQDSTKQFFSDLNDMERKTVNVFCDIKNNIENIIEIYNKNKNEYLNLLQNEIEKINKLSPEKEELNDSSLPTPSDLEIKKDKDYFYENFKYKIKIIDEPTILIKYEEKKEKEKTKKEKEKENAYKMFINKDKLFLSEEDVYNIVSKIYNYDFKMLNKSDYNLDIEKKKLKVSELAAKLLSFNKEKNINEIITDEEVNELYNLLENNIDNIYKFFNYFNNFRISGKYEMTERAFNIVGNLFKFALDYLLKKIDSKLEGLVIILSQTFCVMKDGEKFYLQQHIKEHPLFKKQEFWENHLLGNINQEIKKLERDEKNGKVVFSKEVKKKKINEIIITKIIPVQSYMAEFGVTKEMILNIINPIMNEYNIDESKRIMVMTMLEQNFSN